MKKIINTVFLVLFVVSLIIGLIAIRFDIEKVCEKPAVLNGSNECVITTYEEPTCRDGASLTYNKMKCTSNGSYITNLTPACPDGFQRNPNYDGDESQGQKYCYKEEKEVAQSRLQHIIEKFKK